MKAQNITILIVSVCFCACHKDKPIEPEPEVFNFDCSRYPVTGYFEDYELDPRTSSIPEAILDTISTEGLLLSCLHYPYMNKIFLSGEWTVLPPAYSILENTPFISELFEKEHAHLYIYERYLCAGVGDIGLLSSHRYFYLEFFLLYPPVFSKYNEMEKTDILGRSIETYEDYFSTNGGYSMASVILAGKILMEFDYQPFQEFLDTTENSYIFFDTALLGSMSDDNLARVIEYANDYLKNN